MSHGDSIDSLPESARLLAEDDKGLIVAFCMDRLLAFQFHPEVSHTENGDKLLNYFAVHYCKASPDARDISGIKTRLIQKIKDQVPEGEKVFCALSGGVDSTVVSVLLSRALGLERVKCVFVDTGFLRQGEYEEVLHLYQDLDLEVKGVQAKEVFLNSLKGVSDPEKKRKIIGKIFIDIFKQEMRGCKYLAQGTLYPDVIESLSLKWLRCNHKIPS